jgi:hypothetical protein
VLVFRKPGHGVLRHGTCDWIGVAFRRRWMAAVYGRAIRCGLFCV